MRIRPWRRWVGLEEITALIAVGGAEVFAPLLVHHFVPALLAAQS